MGKRGTKKTPTRKLELRGSWRAKIRPDEPRPKVCQVLPTERIRNDEVALAEWNRISDELYNLGILTDLDRTAMELYCLYYSEYCMAKDQLKEPNDYMFTTEKGYESVSPYVRLKNEAAMQIMKLGVKLGLTPSDRADMKVEPVKPKEKGYFRVS